MIIAQSITDDDGQWEVYLNDGFYIVKVNGTALGGEFNRVFRLKVMQDGKFSFDHLTKNILTDQNINQISRGSGNITIKDNIIDKWNNPVNDVQVNVYNINTQLDDSTIIAQDYTNSEGQYILYLNPGTYIFEYYHPNFSIITETKIINTDGSITIVDDTTTTTSNTTTDNSKFSNNYYSNVINNTITNSNNLALTSTYLSSLFIK